VQGYEPIVPSVSATNGYRGNIRSISMELWSLMVLGFDVPDSDENARVFCPLVLARKFYFPSSISHFGRSGNTFNLRRINVSL